MTRTGKIARLPKPIRDQLNQRLQNGEKGAALVRWLNSLHEVQHLIQHEFGGFLIREQNLSEWKKGGYLDWLAQQERLSMVHQMQEQAEELAQGTTPTDLNRQLSVILMAELAQALRDLKQIADTSERAGAIGQLVTRFAQLRREESSAHRAELACEKWKRQAQKEKADEEFACRTPIAQTVSLYQQMVRAELDRQAEMERRENENEPHSLTGLGEGAVGQASCLSPSSLRSDELTGNHDPAESAPSTPDPSSRRSDSSRRNPTKAEAKTDRPSASHHLPPNPTSPGAPASGHGAILKHSKPATCTPAQNPKPSNSPPSTLDPCRSTFVKIPLDSSTTVKNTRAHVETGNRTHRGRMDHH